MDSSFWKQALARLPQHVQHRHAAAFEAAERFENIFDSAWNAGREALAQSCRLAGRGLGTASRVMDAAARRLLFSR